MLDISTLILILITTLLWELLPWWVALLGTLIIWTVPVYLVIGFIAMMAVQLRKEDAEGKPPE